MSTHFSVFSTYLHGVGLAVITSCSLSNVGPMSVNKAIRDRTRPGHGLGQSMGWVGLGQVGCSPKNILSSISVKLLR